MFLHARLHLGFTKPAQASRDMQHVMFLCHDTSSLIHQWYIIALHVSWLHALG